MSTNETGCHTDSAVMDYLGRMGSYAAKRLTKDLLNTFRESFSPVSYFHRGEQRNIDVISFSQGSLKMIKERLEDPSTIGDILRLCAPFEKIIPRIKRENILRAVTSATPMNGILMHERWRIETESPTWFDVFAELTFKAVDHGRDDFTKFIRSSLSFNWVIVADFCIADITKINDVFAFSIFALKQDMATTVAEFNVNVPRDYKKTKHLEEAELKFIGSTRIFTFAFILPRNRKLFENVVAARNTIDEMIKMLENKPEPSNFTFELQQWKRVRQEANASAFNFKRFQDIFLTSALAGIVATLLAAEGRAVTVSFIPDRDAMTDSYEGLLLELFGRNTLGLSLANHLPLMSCTSHQSGILDSRERPWFDPLIRVPDHIAGILSSISFTGTTHLSRPKRDEPLLKKVLADNRNIIIVNFDTLNPENTSAHGLTYSQFT